jgi:hypothetical protein
MAGVELTQSGPLTPLAEACRRGHVDVAKYLLEKAGGEGE